MKLQLPKLPKIALKRPAFLTPKPKKPVTLRAATASHRMKPGVDDYEEEEPQTKLSSAFFVVLILHVVAVGGIYAFNSIKEHRRGLEPRGDGAKVAAAEKPAPQPAAKQPTAPKAAAPEPVEAPVKPAATAVAAAPVPPVVTAPVSGSRVYHVKAGDTLTSIARQTGTTVAALQMVNKDTATLKPGQVLNVPARSASAAPVIEPPAPNPVLAKAETSALKPAAANSATGSYVVKSGDTATSIAKRYGVSVDELLKLNKISDPKKLQLGTPLKVPSKKN